MPTNSAQSVDLNGYLLIEGCPLSSFGIYDYSAAQVGEEDGDPMRIVKVLRPESTVTDPELLRTLSIVPFIDEHDYLNGDPNATDADGMDPDEKGVAGVLFNIRWDAPWLRGDIKIFSRRLRLAIEQGKKDLSLGYIAQFVKKPGVWRGQPYEYIQVNMRANHIALVDEARVAGARVLDGLVFDSMRLDVTPSKSNLKEATMPLENKEDTERTGDSGLGDLVAILQGLAPKLKAAIQELEGTGGEGGDPNAGGDPAASGDPDAVAVEGGDPTTTPDPDAGATEQNSVDAHGEEAGAQPGDQRRELADAVRMLDELLPKAKQLCGVTPGAKAGDNAEGSAVDTDHTKEIEDGAVGLAGTADKENKTMPVLTGDQTDGDLAKVSSGPAKGENAHGKVGDAALKRFHADVAQRDALYERFSPIVGVFDHKSLTASETAGYLVKKLKLNASAGTAMQVLDSYYLGRKAAQAKAPQATKQVGDSAGAGMSSALSKFLNGG